MALNVLNNFEDITGKLIAIKNLVLENCVTKQRKSGPKFLEV